MTKIIFAIDTLQTGGAEKSTLDIVSRLPRSITPIVVSFYNNLELKTSFDDAGIRTQNFQLKEKYAFAKGIKLFKQFCVEENPDLVVATLFRAEIISRIVCHQLKIKNIGTFVNDTYSRYELEDLSAFMKLKIGFFWVVNRWTANYCHRFLANSESIKSSNVKKMLLRSSDVDVIYRGRKISVFKFNSEGRFAQKEIHFLNVGRLLKRKGQYELIEAFAKFNKQYPESKLTIAGEGSFRPHLEALIDNLQMKEKVKLLGNVKCIPTLLKECDVFVFPSYYEGFSGALVEAMLAGAPILASDIPMNREAVKHLTTAFLFNVKNVESLEQALIFAATNKEIMKNMAKEARILAEERYDIDKIVQQHAELYKTYTT